MCCGIALSVVQSPVGCLQTGHGALSALKIGIPPRTMSLLWNALMVQFYSSVLCCCGYYFLNQDRKRLRNASGLTSLAYITLPLIVAETFAVEVALLNMSQTWSTSLVTVVLVCVSPVAVFAVLAAGFLAAVFLGVAAFFAAFLGAAFLGAAFLGAAFFAVVFFAVDFFAVDFLGVGLLFAMHDRLVDWFPCWRKQSCSLV